MKLRLVLAGAAVLAVSGGFAATAVVGSPVASTQHVVCVLDATPQAPNQEGICVGWTGPVAQPQ